MKSISVSKITGMLNKPALMFWAVNCAADHMRDALKDMPLEGVEEAILRAELEKLISASKSAHRAIADYSKQVGKEVHGYIEHVVNGNDPEAIYNQLSPEAKTCVSAFGDFCEEHGVIPDMGSLGGDTIAFEEPVSGEFGTAGGPVKINGRIDWIYKSGTDSYIVDIKTSSGIYPEMGYQLGGYHALWGREAKIAVLRLDKKGKGFEFEEFDPDVETAKFRALREAYITLNC